MNIEEADYTVFDLETTGLFAGAGDAICEIGAIRTGPDGTQRRFETLVDPKRPVSREAQALNRIIPDMLEGKPEIGDVLPDFMDFIKGSVLAAYNARFDISFLAAALGERRVLLNEFRVVDVLELARRYFDVEDGYSLGSVARHLGMPEGRAHRAIPDVIVTLEVFRKTMPILRARGVEKVEDISRVYYQTAVGVAPAPSVVADRLALAIREKITVKVRYKSPWKDMVTERTITPIRIQGEYVYSFCHLRGGMRTFLIKHIECVDP